MIFENINLHSDISFIISLFRNVALCERENQDRTRKTNLVYFCLHCRGLDQ